MSKLEYILPQGYLVDDKYRVIFPVKRGKNAETYRVREIDGKTKLLKLFAYAKLDRTQFAKNGEVLEVEVLKKINHPNLISYSDHGTLLLAGQKYCFIVVDFISGETLAEKTKRERVVSFYEAKNIILGVLNGLNYLHGLEDSLIHNNITNLSVMLDMSGKITVPKVINFSHARFISQSNKEYLKAGLSPYYQADEAFNGVFSVQSDVYSVGALYYHLLFGLPPWFVEVTRYKSDYIKLEEVILNERKNPLKLDLPVSSIDKNALGIIHKALQSDIDDRFKNVKEFIQAINGELAVQQLSNTSAAVKPKSVNLKNGKGFQAIAGMQHLKDIIQLDVIDALNNKEKYEEYGLTIPNGMLLYGPPGCGKTFFAERMAEEIGFNFYQIKPSDIQSKWVNASQENIKTLFDEARKNAPSVIFVDELDAVVPNRNDSNVNHMNSSAVNEFLAQMNNSGSDGVFVIGATNRPRSIDPAILRAGRLDKVIYLPPPDFEARKLMFELYLKNRPREIGLDYLALANATENYVSSDIKFLCDEASRNALKLNVRISNVILLDSISNNKPSISLKELRTYVTIKAQMEGESENNNERSRIGFKKN